MSQKSAINVLYGLGGIGTTPPSLGDTAAIQAILDVVKKHGHHQLDTARVYGTGTSETLIGSLKYAEQGFLLDTKVPPGMAIPQTAENVKNAVEKSLAELQTEKVHVLYLHAPDRNTPFEETYKALDEQYRKGRFEKLGLSNYKAEDIEQFMEIANKNNYVKPSVYQGHYNLLSRDGEEKLFPTLRKYNISFYAYSPLGGSFLTGTGPENRRFVGDGWVQNMYRGIYFHDSFHNALAQLQEAAKKHNITTAEIALRWLTHHSILKREHGDAIIIGGTTLSKIEQNLDAADKPALSSDVLELIEKIWRDVKAEAPSYYIFQ